MDPINTVCVHWWMVATKPVRGELPAFCKYCQSRRTYPVDTAKTHWGIDRKAMADKSFVLG